MPINQEIFKAVGFIGCKDDAGEFHARGTAFVVGFPVLLKPGLVALYLVTASHVLGGLMNEFPKRQIDVRFNTKHPDIHNGIYDIYTQDFEWVNNPNGEDIAVRASGPVDYVDYLHISVELFSTQESLEREKIGLGDEVYLTGLFSIHPGKTRILPIMRSGIISRFSGERIPSRKLGSVDAHLIEVRSIGGLSGSPVFVVKRTYEIAKTPQGLGVQWIESVSLLGLVHGHFDTKEVLDSSYTTEDQKINIGIAMVIPAKHILDTLNIPRFVEKRKKDVELYIKENPENCKEIIYSPYFNETSDNSSSVE